MDGATADSDATESETGAPHADQADCICTADYSPVCGKDGKTYSNACGAACAGVEVRRKGECLGDGSGGNCRVQSDAGSGAGLLLAVVIVALRRRTRVG